MQFRVGQPGSLHRLSDKDAWSIEELVTVLHSSDAPRSLHREFATKNPLANTTAVPADKWRRTCFAAPGTASFPSARILAPETSLPGETRSQLCPKGHSRTRRFRTSSCGATLPETPDL